MMLTEKSLPPWLALFPFILMVTAIEPYPLGINFGPRQLSAAFITARGEPVILASLTGSDRYQALIADSLANEGVKVQKFGKWYRRDGESLIPIPPDTESNAEALEILKAALSALRERVNANYAGSGTAAAALDLTSISIPRHFNDTLRRTAQRAASELDESGIVFPWQVRRYYDVARLAYHLNSCAGFGLDTSTCDIDEDTHLLFFIDYNDAYLELCVAEVTDYIFGETARKRFAHIGSETLLANTTGNATAYWDRVRGELRGFLEAELPLAQASQFLRAIVFSGEAPARALERVRDIVKELLPGQDHKIRDTIAPMHVGAVGAAEWAKLQVEDPRILKDITTVTWFGDDEAHDEL